MKNIKYLIIAILLIGSAGCEDFLEEVPQDFISPSNFFQSEADIEAAVVGAYSTLNSRFDMGELFYFETASDILEPASRLMGGNSANIGLYLVTPAWTTIDNFWKGHYKLIARSNTIIEALSEKDDINIDLKNEALGEAYFLKSYAYYNLVILWGDVPLFNKPVSSAEAENARRTSKEVIWDQIISDLTLSASLLPEKAGPNDSRNGRVGRAAAQTLLAKTYMWNQQWSDAKTMVDAVLNSGAYELEENVTSIFRVSNENGKESIFEIQMQGSAPRLGSFHLNMFLPRKNKITRTSYAGFLPTSSVIDMYEATDDRRTNWLWDNNIYNGESWVDDRPHLMKFYDPDFNVDAEGLNKFAQNENNYVVFRLADVYLMSAEIENELAPESNLAIDRLNEIRARANATLYQASGVSKEEFREVVFEERAKELIGENQRLYDLRRRGWDYLKEKVEKRSTYRDALTLQNEMYYYPIPQVEMDLIPFLSEDPIGEPNN